MTDKTKKRSFQDSIIGCIILTLLTIISWMFLAIPFDYLIEPAKDVNSNLYTILDYAVKIYQIIPCLIFMLIYIPDRPLLSKTLPGGGNNAKNALIGLAFGFVLNSTCVIVSILTGDIHLYYSNPNWLYIILAFLAVFLQSYSEEFVCRLFLYQHLLRGYKDKPWVAMLIPSLIFAALHLLNPGTDAYSVIDSIVIGIVWSLMVYLFDSFWMACFYHTAWNFTQSILFGLPNSGLTYPLSVFKLESASAAKSFSYDPRYGVEGSLLALILDVTLMVVLIIMAVKKEEAKKSR